MEVDVLSDDPLVSPVLPASKPVVIPDAPEEWQLYQNFLAGPKPGLTEPEKEAERELYRKAGLLPGRPAEEPATPEQLAEFSKNTGVSLARTPPGISQRELIELESRPRIQPDTESIWDSIPQPDDYAETQAAKQAAGQRDATIAEIQESHKVNGTINLILDPRISAKDLANIAEKKENGFDLVSETLQLRPQWTPEIQTKVSEAHRILNERRRVIPTGKDIVESGIELPTMFADWVGATWGWAKQFKTGVIGESSDSPLSRIFSGGGPGPENLTPEDAEARRLRELKAVGQATAASAASMTHFGTELPLDFVEKVLGKNAAEWTPEDSAKELANRISRNVNRKNILAGGGGEFIPKFSPGVREEMKAGDSDIDPVVSEEIEAGDPFSLMAIGPAFKGIGVVLQVPKAAFKAATRAGLGAAADAAFVAAAPAEVRGALLGAIEGEAAKRGVVGEISKAAGEIIGPTARKVDEALSAAGKFISSAQTVVGKGIQSVGVVADTFAKWAENVAPGVTRAATAAALIGGSTSGLGNVVAGFLAGGGNISKFVRPVTGTLGAIRKQAQNLGYTGKSIAAATSEQMAATPIRGSAAAAIKGTAQSVPRVVEGAVHGAALDLSLSALTTLTSDNHSALQLGAALGIVGGLRSGFMRTVGEVRMGDRDWGHDTPVSTSGVIQPFETMSASAYAAAPRGVQRRVNSLRQLLKGIDANADLFMADPTRTEQRQVSTTNFDGTTHVRWKEIHTDTEAALIELGFSKSQAEFYAGQNGWFDANLSVPGQPGKTKRVIVVNSVDSAPHEAKHAFQNVNGELANQVLDRVVRDSFNDEMWDFLGRDYTEKLLQRRLRPDESWVDLVLGASGDGATAADLKLKLHAVEELQRTLGREATNEEVRALHSVTATDAGIVSTVETQGGWREVLTPAERKQAADRYIAREISAETFDAVFKHFGPAMAEKGGLISFFAKLVASTVDLLGGDSLRGRTSEVLAVPLRPEIVGEVTSQVRGRLAEVAGSRRPVVTPEVRPTQKPSPLPSGAPAPVTPEDRAAAAEEARTFAEKAADAPLHNVADAQSPKETLGIVAEAIANDSGVSYEYYGARGEKTSIDPDKKREQRRKEIEGSRNFPNDMRDLLGRRGFPYRVDQRGSVIQVLDWTPDMLASNALRWAKALSELSKKDPSNPALQRIPKEFQLDVAAEDWTTETWRKILDSSKAFSENQLAGFTGAGNELVIPRNLPGMKEFSDPRQIGTPTSIDQNTADFVNMLYSLRPPETPRAGDAIPRNIAAQNIAEATGGAERVVEPAQREVSGELIERKPFSTEVTARYGRGDIKEINPLRGELERALQSAGIPIPKTIEVVRRLNVDRIHSANHEPLLAKTVGGNIVTLQAGFSPPAKPNNEMAIRSAAVRDETTGRIYEAGIHAIAREDAESRGAKGPFTDGYVTNRKIPGNKLEFLNRDEASARAEEIGQMSSAALQGAGGLESSRFELTRKFSPAANRKEVELEGPDGKKYKATFDGYWDWTSVGRGHIPSFTALEDMPGAFAKNGTGMGPSFEKAGYKLPADLPAPETPQGEEGAIVRPPGSAARIAEGPAKFSPAKNTITNPKAEKLADEYVKTLGLPKPTPTKNRPLPVELLKQAADELESTPHAPDDPVVAQGYTRMLEEIMKQGQLILDSGIDVEPWPGQGEPYKSSRDMIKDVVENNHLYFLPTETAFGAEGGLEAASADIQNNLLTRPSGMVLHGRELNVNEVLRFVHDFFGHTPEGAEFGPRGEFNALLTHLQMFPADAKPALLSELFMQSSWYFANKSLRRPDGSVPKKGDDDFIPYGDPRRQFADPKNLLPSEDLIQKLEAELGKVRTVAFGPREKKEADPLKFLGTQHGSASKAWILPSGRVEQLGAQWHHDWLSDNPEVAAKYKLDVPAFEGNEVEGVREGALNKGFARVNLDNGVLTVEAREKDWRHVRPIIEDLIEKNLDDVDRFRVGLLNETATDLRKTFTAKLFDADNDQAKMDRVYEAFSEDARNERGAAFSPGKGIIGRVNEDGEITSKKGNLGLMSHNSLTGSGESWRYVQDTGEVFWWFNKPDAKTQDIVTSWLESKGNKVSSHKVLGEGTPEQDFSRSHGRFSPKREQFEDPETIREALASPGWAIITGTQEKIAGKAASWDDPRNIAANARLRTELKAKGYEVLPVEGKYKGESQGESFAVMGITPADAQALGKKYGQESILTNKGLVYGDGSTTPAVPEKTLIGPEAEAQDFYSITPDGTAFSIGLDFDKPYKPVGEQQELFGKTESEAQDFSRRMRARIADKKERFPESAPLGYEKNADGSFRINAKTGKPVPEKQDHNFLDSGLAKESGKGLRGEAREAAYVKAAGDAMAEEYKKAVKNPEVAAGAKWYSTLRTRLRKLFGDQSQLVCEVLAATSARTPVETNYRFGIDAVNKFNAGDYDAQIAKYQEGLDNWDAGNINDYVTATGRDNPKRATFLDWWIDTHALKPRQSNGKLFAANSKAVLRALHGSWEGGKKTRQFSQNMSGADFGATVDVWAARTLHRISNENRVARWRILAEHENAVQDNDFDVAQKVFKHAADKAGIKPDALQGVLWFREKDLWEKRGWTRGSGAEKSDFSSLIAETEKTPTGQYKIKSPQGEFQFSPKKKLGECVGNCVNAKIVEDIFGSVSEFAGQVEEHGDNFSYRGVQVVYDPKKDIHTFYKDAYVQPRPSKLVADQIKAQVDESRAWIAGRSMNK